MTQIKSLKDLCDCFYADEPAMLNRRIYKGTDCGASISVRVPSAFLDEDGHPTSTWIHNGDQAWRYLTMDTHIEAFTIQTIVEGSDATVDSEPFALPVPEQDVYSFIKFMEEEASMLWEEANLGLEGGLA